MNKIAKLDKSRAMEASWLSDFDLVEQKDCRSEKKFASESQEIKDKTTIEDLKVSSKLPSRRLKNEFYRYYAGYSLQFAEWAIIELGFSPGSLIVDPWNGSGTTAAACVSSGMSYHGYDINPVMIHLSRARVASKTDFDEANDLIDQIDKIIGSRESIDIHSVGLTFRQLKNMSNSARSILITALFPYVRKMLGSSKTKNPSWFKVNSTLDRSMLCKSDLFDSWKKLIKDIYIWQPDNRSLSKENILIERRDSRDSMKKCSYFDGFLTSPPYLTRLDYVQATLPELILLNDFETAQDIKNLRQSMLGTPLTRERATDNIENLPKYVRELLIKIKTHPSKASATYYHRFFSSYFVDIQKSIRNLHEALKPGSVGCMVVQSSHYKEIEIDLSHAVISLSSEIGLQTYKIVEFKNYRSISFVNSRAHIDARKPKGEFAIFLKKE